MADTKRFEGYGVLVTGAARGIGAAVARRLAEERARVLVTDMDAPEAKKTAARLREQGLATEALACDVADRASVEAAVAHAVGAFGSLDVLVNSAASCTPDTPLFEDGPDEAWTRDGRRRRGRRLSRLPRRGLDHRYRAHRRRRPHRGQHGISPSDATGEGRLAVHLVTL